MMLRIQDISFQGALTCCCTLEAVTDTLPRGVNTILSRFAAENPRKGKTYTDWMVE